MTAVIDGRVWYAEAPVLVTLRAGLLGVVGFDGGGTGIALAMRGRLVGAPQLIGRSAANAIVTIDGRKWIATAGRGGGSLVLHSLANGRATGEFSFTAVGTDTADGIVSVRATEGRFDVRL